jgi:hypothetical protein
LPDRREFGNNPLWRLAGRRVLPMAASIMHSRTVQRAALAAFLLLAGAALGGCETTGGPAPQAAAVPMTHQEASLQCWMSTEKEASRVASRTPSPASSRNRKASCSAAIRRNPGALAALREKFLPPLPRALARITICVPRFEEAVMAKGQMRVPKEKKKPKADKDKPKQMSAYKLAQTSGSPGSPYGNTGGKKP